MTHMRTNRVRLSDEELYAAKAVRDRLYADETVPLGHVIHRGLRELFATEFAAESADSVARESGDTPDDLGDAKEAE